MRVSLNGTDHEQNVDLIFQEAFSNIQRTYPHFDGTKWEKGYNHRAIAYFCPHCGCEIHGEWTLTTVYDGKYNEKRASEQLLFDGYRAEDFSKLVSQINDYVVSKQLEVLLPSIKRAVQLTDCPMCAGKVLHKPGYFLIYSSIDGGCTLDQILDAHYPRKEVEDSFFSDDDIHFVWDDVLDRISKYHNGDFYYTKQFDPDLKKNLPIVLQVVRPMYDKAELTKEWNDYCQSCDLPVADCIPGSQTESIKESSQKLKGFIQNLLNTEINIYSVSQHLRSLYFTRPVVNRRAMAKALDSQIHVKEQIKAAQEGIAKAENTYKLACNNTKQLMASAPEPVNLLPPTKPAPPVPKIPGLFNKKKVLADNTAQQNQFQLDLITYQESYQRYLEEKANLENQNAVRYQQDVAAAIESEKIAQNYLTDKQRELQALEAQLVRVRTEAPAVSVQSSLKELIDQEITNAETTLKKLYECRNKLYATDLVFVKYRNPVALAAFSEYLTAGRCTTLEGPDGAYNLYENQIRADMIIGQLSKVLEKLDEIKENQYLIYSEIQRVNKNLDRMNDTMQNALNTLQSMDKNIQHISENSDIIAHNTAVTAHYAKVNAELTNALGYMVAFS